MKTNKYDIIIAGGGLSGLSLAWYLLKGGYKGEVLIVDSTFAPGNTKTWAFWFKGKPPFNEIVYKTWRKTFFSSQGYDSFLYMNEYSYHCIRESDFKEHILTEIKKKPNFHLLEEGILDVSSNKKKAVLITKSSDSYIADYIFQSIFKPPLFKKKDLKYPLIQHFYGIEIKTRDPIFDSGTFTIMDFDESFTEAPAFMYVLPFREDKALLEFTVFSKKTLKKKEYRKKIKAYLFEKFGLQKEDYKIKRREYGEIPMDDRPYIPFYKNKILNIGTVGGLTKPSTGYTFTRVQEYSKKLAQSIIDGKEPVLPTKSKARYRYYDLLLLHVLSSSTEESLNVFKDLFQKHSIDTIFDFLSEETNVIQDFKIMNSVKASPFLKAIVKNIKND
ncbi:MAG: lycopene cyclase family protein [Balneolaceae bacterium]